MSRSAKADSIRDAFLHSLKLEGVSVETMADMAAKQSNEMLRNLFFGLGRAGREVYLVRGLGFVNVHIRSESPGWWSILKTVKRDLDILAKELKIGCYFVLLVGRNDMYVADGYIVTDFKDPPFLRPPGVEVTKYTVNERSHLDATKRISSVKRVATSLAAMRGAGTT